MYFHKIFDYFHQQLTKMTGILMIILMSFIYMHKTVQNILTETKNGIYVKKSFTFGAGTQQYDVVIIQHLHILCKKCRKMHVGIQVQIVQNHLPHGRGVWGVCGLRNFTT